jgi:DNA-binding transcriptional ArsR family regulator
VRSLPHPALPDLQLPIVLHALGDPVRLELVRRLSAGTEITCAPAGLDVPKSTLSNHWRILREAGLTATVIDGRTHRMRLRAADLGKRFPGLLDAILGAAAHADSPPACTPDARAPAHSNTRPGRSRRRRGIGG